MATWKHSSLCALKGRYMYGKARGTISVLKKVVYLLQFKITVSEKAVKKKILLKKKINK